MFLLLISSIYPILSSVLVCLVSVTFLIMIMRTLCVEKIKQNLKKVEYNLDLDTACAHLSDAVKIPTVSPKFAGDNKENFFAYEAFLEKSYPLIHNIADKTVINNHALIFKIKGDSGDMLPIAFLAHQDVVPSSESGWEYPPFSGQTVNLDGEEYIYGRGTMDMKGQMIAILEAVEYCLENNLSFKRDVYLCFGYDEELTGVLGASKIVDYLRENNIKFEFLIDEGGVVLEGSMLGIDGKIALIGNSEKGYLDLALTATCDGGHSSSPVHPTSIEKLSKAIYKLSKRPMAARWTQSTEELFDTLTPHFNFLGKFICVNRKIFSPLLKLVIAKVNPAAEAVIRTTIAPTMVKGSDAYNTISKTATANINCRLLAGDTEESVSAYIQKIVGKDIKVERQIGTSYDAPSGVSTTDTDSYKLIAKSVVEAFDGLIPAPFPFIAGSDAKFYYPVAKHIYRFSPFIIDQADAERIHGVNERIATKELLPAITFFIRVIENANQ